MKRIAYICAILLSSVLMFSCSDYLEAPPSVDLDEDGVFADRTLTEQYITGIYAEGMPLGFSMGSSGIDRKLCATSTLAGACDEAEQGANWGKGNASWNVDNHNNSSIDWDEDPRHNTRWQTLRKCNIVLERIDEVPDDPGDVDFKTRSRGEAYFMRALVFWEGVYRYGGLPIIHRRINPSEDGKLPRNTFSDCVDSILVDCDRAASILPDYYTNSILVGRANRIAALALKSRVLLYAASPLFNTDDPYLPLSGNNDLIGYGNYSKERWNEAAKAAKAAITAVESSGYYDLYDEGTPETNYEHVWTAPDNKEIILANKKYRNFTTSSHPITSNIPAWAGSSWSDGGLFTTFNFVRFYEKKDGNQQTWNMDGGDDLLEKYDELDPRFAQTIAAHGANWNTEIGILNFLPGGAHNVANDKTKHLVRKWVPRVLRATAPRNSTNMDWIVFRVAELYLNYAEALNELTPGSSFEVATWDGIPYTISRDKEEMSRAISQIRIRGGVPDYEEQVYEDSGELRKYLKRERQIELLGENQRYYDLRRWKDVEKEEAEPVYGCNVLMTQAKAEDFYDRVRVEKLQTSFSRKMYFWPIDYGELKHNKRMTQAPGWKTYD